MEADDRRLVIRAYTETDEAQVIQLWREVFPDNPSWNVPKGDFDRKLTVQRELFLVGDLGGEIVATVMAGFDGHRGWVHLVAVAPKHRQQGFGRTIMVEAEKRLREISCTKVNLQVRATNEGVIAFYKNLGYLSKNESAWASGCREAGGRQVIYGIPHQLHYAWSERP